MGGCFSGQKGLESENAPVQAPVSPKAPVAEPATAAPDTENVVEIPNEPLVDASERNEEVKKEAEVVPKETEVVAEPVVAAPAPEEKLAEEKAPDAVSQVKEEAKVAEVAVVPSGTEDKTSAAPATQ